MALCIWKFGYYSGAGLRSAGDVFSQDFRAFLTLCCILLLFTFVAHLQYYAKLLHPQVPQAMLALKHLNIFFVYT